MQSFAATTLFRRAAPRTLLATRAFHASGVRAAGKESELHNENRPAEAEAAKQQQLRDQKAGKNTWKDELASDSESAVKADRGEHGKGSIEQLQKESAQKAQEKHK